MYGFSDHAKGIPFTRLSALRQGSSRNHSHERTIANVRDASDG